MKKRKKTDTRAHTLCVCFELFRYVFRLTGGTTCVTLGCILPSIIYLKLYNGLRVTQKQKVSRTILMLLAAFGVVSGVVCTWSAIRAVDKADSEIRHHHHHHPHQ